MKVLDKPVATKQAAFATTNKIICNYCKKEGHTEAVCRKKRDAKTSASTIACRAWDPKTKTCAWENRTSGKCKFLHPPPPSANAVEEDPAPAPAQPVFMVTFEKQKRKRQTQAPTNSISQLIYKTLTKAAGPAGNLWVIDGAATINLANGVGCVPGSIKAFTTILEVVGQTKITCETIADYVIPSFLPGGGYGPEIALSGVPILPSLKYNLLSERKCTENGQSVIKTGPNCWILAKDTQFTEAVAVLAKEPPLYFLGTTQELADRVKVCTWQQNLAMPRQDSRTSHANLGGDKNKCHQKCHQKSQQQGNEEKATAGQAFLQNTQTNTNQGSINIDIAKNSKNKDKSTNPLQTLANNNKDDFALSTHNYTQQNTSKIQLWHERLGHIHYESVAKLLNGKGDILRKLLPGEKHALISP